MTAPMTHPLAGQLAPPELLTDIPALLAAWTRRPDPADPRQRVAFGTSGHRGSALDLSFNEDHVLAVVQAVCEFRQAKGIDGPLFLGCDTHALSAPAAEAALSVLAAHGVQARVQAGGVPTPTPVVSHAILTHNRGAGARADGLIVTPSHNPPRDGGIKYNPPHGGPADTDVTGWIEARANALLERGNAAVRRHAGGTLPSCIRREDFLSPYVEDLPAVVDMEAIRGAGLRLGADPMGGAALACWQAVAQCHGLAIEVVNPRLDPAFAFVALDHDGRIRMDCSSRHAMAGLLALRDRFDVAWGNDADADRHGIVTPAAGLMNPNHYLAVAVDYLLSHRPGWPASAAVGKTLVSSALIDRVAAARGRRVLEVPVGFKWFSAGLLEGSLGFAGEESAGASLLRRDGHVWTTDKDGIAMALLAAEITAVTGRDPGLAYEDLAERLGRPHGVRIDSPASPALKAAFGRLTPEAVRAPTLAGDPITARLTRAPGNGAAIGGLKVVTAQGWFAARPSGTEDIVKIYAESFRGPGHLETLVDEARRMVAAATGEPA